MTIPIRARAPAKAILSGEHAVVYGAPALALAVGRYARVELSATRAAGIELRLTDLGIRCFTTPAQLLDNHHHCQQRYQQFLSGRCSIAEVLPAPESLVLFAVAELLRAFEVQPPAVRIDVQSEIAIGSGMGSSAATVAALLTALAAHLQLNLSRQQVFELTHRIEGLQHGYSSGLDPAACCHGGVVRFDRGRISQPLLNHSLTQGWALLDSGRPEVSTGVCSEQVRKAFGESDIWSEFGAVTEALDRALQCNEPANIATQIRRNHRLLCRIGVVPTAVQQLISHLERQGAAAKVSGAGAVRGETAGLVLVYHPQLSPALSHSRKYLLQPLKIDQEGARIE